MAEAAELPDAADWDEPLGHADVVRGLWRAARSGRLPHSLLFFGPPGVGKLRAARWFSAGLFCERGLPEEGGAPCGMCGACKRLRAGSHPDCMLVDVRQEDPKKRSEELRIGRFVRRADQDYWDGPTTEDFVALRAAEGGWRALHVRESERANDNAQNSILKMLEEPAERVLWILESSDPARLLPTIRSRCVQVRFERLRAAEVEGLLRARGVEPARAGPLARWSDGSPGNALRMWAENAWELRALLVAVLRGEAPPMAASLAAWEVEGRFEGRTPKAQERARLRPVLDLAAAILADFERAQAGVAAEELAHGDLLASAEPPLLARSPSRRARALAAILRLRGDVEANVDPASLLDAALLELAPPLARAAPTR